MAADESVEGGILRTPWRREFATPVRAFLKTESGSAGILVGAIVAGLVWANLGDSYERLWTSTFGLVLGDHSVTRDLRTWVNSGLMAFFFLVVGLEARREIDLGDLRDRSRFLLPVAAGLFGMVVPVALYLAVNAGGGGADGWGVAMSTDTALALGLLVMVGRDVPDRVRAFLLTVFVVDDIVALLVIAVMYTDHVDVAYLLLAIVLYGALLVAKHFHLLGAPAVFVAGVVIWFCVLASGVDPVITGLAIGLTAAAYTPARGDLEEASGLFRQFREEPTPDLARTAAVGLTRTLSPNDRLQRFYHPWTSYVIVPLFALSNAGIGLDGDFLRHAYAAPVTLGVLVGYVVGKPIAVVTTSWAVTRISGGRVRPPIGWAAVIGSGTISGIGFTVALLIASRALDGEELDQAKLGALSAVVVSAVLTGVVYRLAALLSPDRKAKALLGDTTLIQDLIPEIDPKCDHVRGPIEAPITVIEFGDFECPHCGRAEPVVRDLLEDTDVRYVWRHLPLTDVHPQAQLAAEAAEAAAAQGAFWEMHDLLLAHQDALEGKDLMRYAEQLGLDTERFHDDLKASAHQNRVAQDVESADLSGVSGTPTFFVNGQRHYGAFDLDTLSAVIRTAREQLRIRQLAQTARSLVDLDSPVDPDRDHVRGAPDAPVTLVEYGDFECPFCGQAEPVIRELLAGSGDLRYVWRHLPLNDVHLTAHGDDLRYVFRHLPLADVHPNAQRAAEAAEAAGAQGAFWEMHDRLLSHQDELGPRDLHRHAEAIGLDVDRFAEDVRQRRFAARVSEDVASADASGVSGTPTFFINGRRHHGVYDVATLTAAVKAARAAVPVPA